MLRMDWVGPNQACTNWAEATNLATGCPTDDGFGMARRMCYAVIENQPLPSRGCCRRASPSIRAALWTGLARSRRGISARASLRSNSCLEQLNFISVCLFDVSGCIYLSGLLGPLTMEEQPAGRIWNCISSKVTLKKRTSVILLCILFHVFKV